MSKLTVTLRQNTDVGDAVVTVIDGAQVTTVLPDSSFKKGTAVINNFTPIGNTGFNAELSIHPSGLAARAAAVFNLDGTDLSFALTANAQDPDTGVEKFRDGASD